MHIHPDGTRHVHHEATDVHGIYVTHVTFPQPGAWGLEVLAKQGKGPVASSRFSVTVLATSRTPALDTPAPRSHNLIASDVSDLRQIDTSDPPDPRLHQIRIADAIAQGRPQVIVFATPQLCTIECAVQSWMWCVCSSPPMATAWPSRIKRCGRIPRRKRCLPSWWSGTCKPSRGSLLSMAGE